MDTEIGSGLPKRATPDTKSFPRRSGWFAQDFIIRIFLPFDRVHVHSLKPTIPIFQDGKKTPWDDAPITLAIADVNR